MIRVDSREILLLFSLGGKVGTVGTARSLVGPITLRTRNLASGFQSSRALERNGRTEQRPLASPSVHVSAYHRLGHVTRSEIEYISCVPGQDKEPAIEVHYFGHYMYHSLRLLEHCRLLGQAVLFHRVQ